MNYGIGWHPQPTHMVLSLSFSCPNECSRTIIIYGLGVTNVIDIFIVELGIKRGEYSLRG